MVKTFSKLGIEENLLNLLKGIYNTKVHSKNYI